METYLTSILIRKKKTLVKRIFLTWMEFIQFKLLCFNLILWFWRWKVFPLCLCTLWIYRMTSLVSCCARIVNQNRWPTLLHDRADVTVGYIRRQRPCIYVSVFVFKDKYYKKLILIFQPIELFLSCYVIFNFCCISYSYYLYL